MSATAPPPASVWIEHIDRHLPRENANRSRITILRATLLLLQVRSLPDFVLVPGNVFGELEGLVVWPTQHARFQLAQIARCFFDFDDLTIAEIRQHLELLLDEAIPEPTLKEYFSTTFGATCADTDHLGKAVGCETCAKIMFQAALLSLVNALEDFTADVHGTVFSDEEVNKGVGEFYKTQGHAVTYSHNLIFADKDGRSLSIAISNHSSTNGHLLVTVKDESD
jgi:hypothetical protein